MLRKIQAIESPPSAILPLRYNQYALLQKINIYLALKGLPLMNTDGCCHGLTILWLKERDKGRANELYQLIKKIIDCPESQLLNMGREIDALIRSIDRGQYPEKQNPTMMYHQVADIMGAKKQKVLDGLYVEENLARTLRNQNIDHNMICISSKTTDKHTVGIYTVKKQFILYDVNDESGIAKVFYSSQTVAKKIGYCFYGRFGLEIPEKLDLEIKVVNIKNELAPCAVPIQQKPTSSPKNRPDPFTIFAKSMQTVYDQKKQQMQETKKRRRFF